MNQEKEIKNQRGSTVYLPADVWEKLDILWRQKKIKSKTQFFINCVENAEEMVKMEAKVLEIENLKEQIYELQEDNHNYSLKNIDLKRQIASLQDGLEYHKNQADTYAKVLVKIYDDIEYFEEYYDMNVISLADLKELKNSIPETALRR